MGASGSGVCERRSRRMRFARDSRDGIELRWARTTQKGLGGKLGAQGIPTQLNCNQATNCNDPACFPTLQGVTAITSRLK